MSTREADPSEPREDAPERDGWKLVAKVPSRQVAALIEGLLESTGIEVEAESQLFTQEPVALGLLGMIKVWVPSEQYENARKVLAEASLEEGEGGLAEGEDSGESADDVIESGRVDTDRA